MSLKVRRVKKTPLQVLKNYTSDFFERLSGLDKLTLVLVCFLFGIGLLMIYSITSISIYNGVKNDPTNFFIKTLIMAVAGIGAMGVIIIMPYRMLKNLSFLAVIGCPLILLVTLLFAKGSADSDVNSWFQIGSFKLQPAEFVKIGMILAIAWLVSKSIDKKMYYLNSLKDINLNLFFQSFVFVICYFGLCTLLVLLQPDFGSALILGFIGLIMFLATGVKYKAYRPLVYVGIMILITGIFVMIKAFPYQAERFSMWLDDPFTHDKGFQNVMGYTAIALGGLSGVGVGNSTQKYGYVLEPHNDMISTIIAEELGVWMILVIMIAYFVIGIRCFLTAAKCQDMFAALVSVGVGTIFFVQPIINLGGASGALPLTGVTLPFISYGGSSLVSLFLGVGIYLNVRMEMIAQQKKMREQKKQLLKTKVVPFPKS